MKQLHNNAVVLLKCEKSKKFLAAMPSTVLAIIEEKDIMSEYFLIYFL